MATSDETVRTVQETAEEYDISEKKARELLEDMTERAGWVQIGEDTYKLLDSVQATKFVAKHKARQKFNAVRNLGGRRD